MQDNVKKPKHYTSGGLEVITILKKKMSSEEFKGFLKGNVLKYVLRADKKNGLEDYEKAEQYLKWLKEEVKHAGQSGTYISD